MGIEPLQIRCSGANSTAKTQERSTISLSLSTKGRREWPR